MYMSPLQVALLIMFCIWLGMGAMAVFVSWQNLQETRRRSERHRRDDEIYESYLKQRKEN